MAQHRFSHFGDATSLALYENRWSGNAADDERAGIKYDPLRDLAELPLLRRAVTAASRRNAARHRLLTAAPVSLERLHLCCKGSCEFVESSLALSCCGIITTVEFWILQKTEPIHRRF